MSRVAQKMLVVALVTLWSAVPLTAQTSGFSQTSETSVTADMEVPSTPEAMGVLTGVVLRDVPGATPAESLVEGLAGTLIDVLGEAFSASAVTDANGAYQVTVPEGTYQIQASAPTGHAAVESSDVLGRWPRPAAGCVPPVPPAPKMASAAPAVR